jgi:hypothetical protein
MVTWPITAMFEAETDDHRDQMTLPLPCPVPAAAATTPTDPDTC